jgi:nucleosome assembly protein 1-like 1
MIVGAGLEEEEEDEYGPEGFQDFLEADYELGLEFKDKLIPHGVQWFTGEAALGYYMDSEFDEEDDEDVEEDEDDEEEDVAPVKGKKQSSAAPQANQAQPECKQQ